MRKYILVLITGIIWSCGGGGSPVDNPLVADEGKDRKAVLTNLADNIILPSYANFKTKLELMKMKSDAFIAEPALKNLIEFRAAWVDSYIEWQKVEMFDFGPGEKQTIRNFYNIYPANVSGILANIADPTSNLDVPVSYAQQGFPALDYLINGVGKTDTEILAFYTTGADSTRRLAYIKRITSRMSSVLDKVINEWNGSYRETYINKTGLDISSSTSMMINGFVLHYERYIRSGKFGIPSGAMLNGVIAPEKVEAFYKKDISLTLAKTANQAYVDFFNGKSIKTGTEGPSIKTYLDALKAKDSATGKTLSELINAQFELCKSKIENLKPNLEEEVKTNNQAMLAVYTEMQKTTRMLKVDMTSAMSITITYTDNDGD